MSILTALSDAQIMKHLMLDADEKVRLITRRYFLTLISHLLAAFFVIVMPFFLLFPLFSYGWIGISFFIYCVAVGVLLFARTLVMWNFNTLVITTKRVIKTKQKGFFDRTVSEMLISRINDVSHRVHGLWGTILHYGTLHIVAGNGQTVLDFQCVRNPEKAQRILNELLQQIPHEVGAKG
ncbi:hypothetical protein A3H11_02825 [Candidatus Uhrbacteria bacterium RIFCSPLOWO2_12_FULL_47_10]|nr:MAG: hypothetical protein A3J03_02620 [Candidatus Uhrbacteria bacterium RIFCSPLOWO2_02_FULL_46_25]OGL92549.1 MAG: hypothetical protein A3H11_02825 [Candidatus Uhrbacteria bacterium RIFCSPLOWO2_12_FULL_47_10]